MVSHSQDRNMRAKGHGGEICLPCRSWKQRAWEEPDRKQSDVVSSVRLAQTHLQVSFVKLLGLSHAHQVGNQD